MSEPQTPTAGPATADGSQLEQRIDPAIDDLRGHTARGTIVTSAFHIGLAGLGLVQRLTVATFLTREEFGLWGIVLTILVTLSWLKQLGIADKYIQQSEPDQEAAFQKAFTLELGVSVGFFALAAAVLPLYALAYGHDEMILPGILAALSVPISAFETPAWIPYRRLQYLRNRVLATVNPIVSFVVTLVLGAMGYGYWCFVWGVLAGSLVGAIVCVVTSPIPLRLRLDRGTVRDYAGFSVPLFAAGATQLVVVQGSLLVANRTVGLAGVGAIGLAVGIAAFADRVDAIVSQTIYPAVCAVADRTELLYEVFVKSNRVALMWAMPFGAGLALFADDFISFLFPERWEPAIPLVAVLGLMCGIGQVAFNWTVFVRATGDTRPLLVSSLLDLAFFVVVWVPALLTFGLMGWAWAFVATVLGHLVLRGFYMRRLFSGFKLLRQLARGLAPIVPPVAVVLLVRLAVNADERTPVQAVAELSVYVLAIVVSTYLLERRLVLEMLGYLRRMTPRAAH